MLGEYLDVSEDEAPTDRPPTRITAKSRSNALKQNKSRTKLTDSTNAQTPRRAVSDKPDLDSLNDHTTSGVGLKKGAGARSRSENQHNRPKTKENFSRVSHARSSTTLNSQSGYGLRSDVWMQPRNQTLSDLTSEDQLIREIQTANCKTPYA